MGEKENPGDDYFHLLHLGHANSSLANQSHHYPPPPHTNTHQSSNAGNYTQMSNGNENTSHSSYTNNTNHIAGWIEKLSSLLRDELCTYSCFLVSSLSSSQT